MELGYPKVSISLCYPSGTRKPSTLWCSRGRLHRAAGGEQVNHELLSRVNRQMKPFQHANTAPGCHLLKQ